MIELTPLAIQVIFAALISDRDIFMRWWTEVGPQFFADAYYKRIAQFIDDFFQEYGSPPSPATIYDYFNSNGSLSDDDRAIVFKALNDIASAPVQDWPLYQDHLRLYVRKQAFTKALQDAEDLIDGLDFEGVLDVFQKANVSGLERGKGTPNYFGPDAIEARFDRRTSVEMRKRVSLHIGNLDAYIKGGLTAGTLSVFVAATGGGKTTALVHIGKVAVLQNQKVLHLTLEMSEHDMADRYDCAFTGVRLAELEQHAGKIRNEMLSGRTSLGDKLRVVEYPEYSLSPDDLQALMLQLEMQDGFKPDVLLVDYADLMRGGKGKKFSAADKRHELNYIYTKLHAIAKIHNVIVITASQANRGAMNKRLIKITDIAEDISKTFIADHVFSICQSARDRMENRCRVFLAKNRSGPAFAEVKFRQSLATCTFAMPGESSERVVDADELEEDDD